MNSSKAVPKLDFVDVRGLDDARHGSSITTNLREQRDLPWYDQAGQGVTDRIGPRLLTYGHGTCT
jgi:hypothetical protein